MQASNDLIADVVQLPVRPGAAMRLLWMLDDTGASAADLGRLIDSDAELSTQVVRLANTPFYGLPGRVTSAWRAVTVLGLATLRAIATAAAFDLFADEGRTLPGDFWSHSITTAAAASAVARRVGALPNDAFSLGLLHDIGTALVSRRAPSQFDELLEQGELEAAHPHVGVAALSIMRFPADMVEAIGEHHAPLDRVASPWGRLLVAADAVALTIEPGEHETNVESATACAALGLADHAADALVREVRAARDDLTDFG